jgi:hypothetical protein
MGMKVWIDFWHFTQIDFSSCSHLKNRLNICEMGICRKQFGVAFYILDNFNKS